jgi:AcrR family transcriptional regulator
MTSEHRDRPPLTRHRVLRAALDLVDREGLDALTMRRLGSELGVEAMSLYKHVAGKDAILDGIVELVVAEIESPSGADWKEAMRRRAISARAVLGRHSWAIGLLESRRSAGPAALGYLEAVLDILRSAGFSIRNAAHAFWLLDSYVYGHVIQEKSAQIGGEPARPALDGITPAEHPRLVELWEDAVGAGYSVDAEFDYGLDVILDALDRRR